MRKKHDDIKWQKVKTIIIVVDKSLHSLRKVKEQVCDLHRPRISKVRRRTMF